MASPMSARRRVISRFPSAPNSGFSVMKTPTASSRAMIAGRMTESLIRATARAPPADAHPAATAYPQVTRGLSLIHI